jgi:hypothetical protein
MCIHAQHSTGWEDAPKENYSSGDNEKKQVTKNCKLGKLNLFVQASGQLNQGSPMHKHAYSTLVTIPQLSDKQANQTVSSPLLSLYETNHFQTKQYKGYNNKTKAVKPIKKVYKSSWTLRASLRRIYPGSLPPNVSGSQNDQWTGLDGCRSNRGINATSPLKRSCILFVGTQVPPCVYRRVPDSVCGINKWGVNIEILRNPQWLLTVPV